MVKLTIKTIKIQNKLDLIFGKKIYINFLYFKNLLIFYKRRLINNKEFFIFIYIFLINSRKKFLKNENLYFYKIHILYSKSINLFNNEKSKFYRKCYKIRLKIIGNLKHIYDIIAIAYFL